MRALLLGAVTLLCACPSGGGPDGGGSGGGGGSSGGGSGGTGGSGGSGGGAATVARPERWIPSDDGTAVLWVPDGGAPGDVAITVKRRAGALAYELQPSGLSFSPHAVLFMRDAPPRARDGGFELLAAELVSADGGREVATTVRSTVEGHVGEQYDVVATVITHFSEIQVHTATGNLLAGFPASTFNQRVGSQFELELKFVPNGSLGPEPMSWTAQAAGTVSLVNDGTVPTPVPGDRASSFDLTLRCSATPGLGFVKVFLQRGRSLLRIALAGFCHDPEWSYALTAGQFFVRPPAGAALDEALEGAFQGIPEPTPPAPAAPVRELFVADAGRWEHRLELDCYDCDIGPTYNGRYVIVNGTQRAPVISSGAVTLPDNLTPVGAQPFYEGGVPAGGQTLTRTFSYSCVRPGAEAIAASHEAEFFGDLLNPPIYKLDERRAVVSCRGPRNDDQVMMSTNRRVTRSGGSWVAGAPGMAANVGVADDELSSKIRAVSRDTTVYGGVTRFTSRPGKKRLRLKTLRQDVAATYDDAGSRYVVTGAVAQEAFDPMGDTLDVSEDGGTSTSTPAPPPLTNLDQVFGTPAGGATTLSVPDGYAVLAAVFMQMTALAGSPAGSYGLSRVVQLSSVPLVNGRRELTLLEPQVAAEVRASRWTVAQVYVAFCLVAANTTFFSGDTVPVEACQMHQFTGADLGF